MLLLTTLTKLISQVGLILALRRDLAPNTVLDNLQLELDLVVHKLVFEDCQTNKNHWLFLEGFSANQQDLDHRLMALPNAFDLSSPRRRPRNHRAALPTFQDTWNPLGMCFLEVNKT